MERSRGRFTSAFDPSETLAPHRSSQLDQGDRTLTRLIVARMLQPPKGTSGNSVWLSETQHELARVITLKVRILSGERVIAIYEKVAFGLENGY